ncbi:dTDP-4-dehydrorhamnose reductase [uncultured Cohaesibacter sp.]|uniref:dTDP-4-dehydrorhamnose reductase n=1 Tax=uncultured Cohaesibacter sp. TaxID=1002546 RepID=UPI0029C85DD8|nr:dTDP-4-dehydrorhamnose reductase [uncultured Cohaesibacter sp.]
MKILVIGKTGQVARCLADKSKLFPELELVFEEPPELDLTSEASIAASFARNKPELVINAAAYTAVDKAEDEPDLAMIINGTAPGVLAREAKAIGAPILHISTDYVYEGNLDRRYVEGDPVGPLGVYGKTKLAGEEAVRAENPDHTILRTAWVFSPYGGNFVKTMLRLAKDRDVLRVVDDQHGNPTSAHDIATALLTIADARRKGDQTGKGVIYHFVGGVETTWCGFTREIFRISKALSGPSAEVEAITTADYPTKAVRPKNSRLDCSKILADFPMDLDRDIMLQPDVVKAILDEASV